MSSGDWFLVLIVAVGAIAAVVQYASGILADADERWVRRRPWLKKVGKR